MSNELRDPQTNLPVRRHTESPASYRFSASVTFLSHQGEINCLPDRPSTTDRALFRLLRERAACPVRAPRRTPARGSKVGWPVLPVLKPPQNFAFEEAPQSLDIGGGWLFAFSEFGSPASASAHQAWGAGKERAKGLMPENAKEAIGHGVRAKRSKSGAVSFEVLDTEAARASIQ